MADLEKHMDGYRLATAEIVYHMPDQPHQLQTFVWQTLDLAPEYPRIVEFVSRWRAEIKANLHSVRIARGDLIRAVALDIRSMQPTFH